MSWYQYYTIIVEFDDNIDVKTALSSSSGNSGVMRLVNRLLKTDGCISDDVLGNLTQVSQHVNTTEVKYGSRLPGVWLVELMKALYGNRITSIKLKVDDWIYDGMCSDSHTESSSQLRLALR